MKNGFAMIMVYPIVALSLVLQAGCQGPSKETEPVRSLHYETGRELGAQYMGGTLADYRLVIAAYSIPLDNRRDFYDGFADAFAEAGKKEKGIKYAKIVEDAVNGNEYDTARDMGAQHAQRQVTNSQIQNLIYGSLGVSRNTALGWKAGYIEGFKTQKVSQARVENKTIDSEIEEGFYEEAAATYNALRAATGH